MCMYVKIPSVLGGAALSPCANTVLLKNVPKSSLEVLRNDFLLGVGERLVNRVPVQSAHE